MLPFCLLSKWSGDDAAAVTNGWHGSGRRRAGGRGTGWVMEQEGGRLSREESLGAHAGQVRPCLMPGGSITRLCVHGAGGDWGRNHLMGIGEGNWHASGCESKVL
jgi:hypothetical protein